MKKRYVLLSVLVLLAAVALCACGGDKAPESSTPNTSSKSTQTDADAEPTMGGRLVYGMTQDLVSLDPHVNTDAGTRSVVFNMYEGLVKPTSTGELKPAVAETVDMASDAKTYTFTLRGGITFHNGQAVTVEDVQYSIERYAEIQGESSAFFNRLEAVEILDERTVAVHLKESDSEFLSELTLAIIPKDNAEPAQNPIGTGPYRFASYTLGQSLELQRYEGYWQKNGAYLDEVQFKIIADVNTAMTELQAGTIDVLNYLTVDHVQALSRAQGDAFTIVEGNMNLVQAMFLNNSYEPLQDVRVRQALCYAVNRMEINQFLFGGKSHLIGSHMIPGLTQWYEPAAESRYEYNPEMAKQLLAEAGYANGFTLEITVPSAYSQHVATAEIIVNQLAQVGIQATIQQIEWTTWLEDIYQGRNYQATIVGFDGTLAPSDWLQKYGSKAANNMTNYADAAYDETLQKAIAAVEPSEKEALYKELQMNLAENAASVFIQDPANYVALNSRFGGYEFYSTAAWDVSKIYQKAQ